MIPKKLPETPGAVRANIAYLRSRKVALDQLIESLERYSSLGSAPVRKARPKGRGGEPRRLAEVA